MRRLLHAGRGRASKYTVVAADRRTQLSLMLTTLHMAAALGLNLNASLPATSTSGAGVYTQMNSSEASDADPDEVWRVDISVHDGDDDEYEDEESLRIDFRNCAECRDDRREELRGEIARIDALDPTLADRDDYEWDWVYFAMGVAPATSINIDSIHPHLRYDMELGMTFLHPKKKKRTLTLGVDGHVSQFFDRARPGGGADVVGSAQVGNFYARVGAGVLTGIPYGPQSDIYRPAVGGVVGIGVAATDGDFGGRLGVDYDVRVDRGLGLVQTVLLSAKFTWGF
jgi:hypothetical protein